MGAACSGHNKDGTGIDKNREIDAYIRNENNLQVQQLI